MPTQTQTHEAPVALSQPNGQDPYAIQMRNLQMQQAMHNGAAAARFNASFPTPNQAQTNGIHLSSAHMGFDPNTSNPVAMNGNMAPSHSFNLQPQPPQNADHSMQMAALQNLTPQQREMLQAKIAQQQYGSKQMMQHVQQQQQSYNPASGTQPGLAGFNGTHAATPNMNGVGMNGVNHAPTQPPTSSINPMAAYQQRPAPTMNGFAPPAAMFSQSQSNTQHSTLQQQQPQPHRMSSQPGIAPSHHATPSLSHATIPALADSRARSVRGVSATPSISASVGSPMMRAASHTPAPVVPPPPGTEFGAAAQAAMAHLGGVPPPVAPQPTNPVGTYESLMGMHINKPATAPLQLTPAPQGMDHSMTAPGMGMPAGANWNQHQHQLQQMNMSLGHATNQMAAPPGHFTPPQHHAHSAMAMHQQRHVQPQNHLSTHPPSLGGMHPSNQLPTHRTQPTPQQLAALHTQVPPQQLAMQAAAAAAAVQQRPPMLSQMSSSTQLAGQMHSQVPMSLPSNSFGLPPNQFAGPSSQATPQQLAAAQQQLSNLASSISNAPLGGLQNPPIPKPSFAHIHPALDTLETEMTRVAPLPPPSSPSDATHGSNLPPVSEKEMESINKWRKRDKEYLEIVKEEQKRREEELRNVGGRPVWWERDTSVPDDMSYLHGMTKLSVVWPVDGRKKREKMKGRKEPKIPKQVNREVAKKPESLVPIRIEIDYDHYRLRETFIWNAHDPVVTPEMFVQTTCEDMQLPSQFASHFLNQLKQQILDYQAHSVVNVDAAVPEAERVAGKFAERDDAWWERWRKKLRTDDGFVGVGGDESEGDVLKHKSETNVEAQKSGDVDAENPKVAVVVGHDTPDERPKTPHKEHTVEFDVLPSSAQGLNHDMRILIKLDIIVDSMNLVDQFEWDLHDPNNSPEQFAEVYTADLGLSGEFKTAIVHDIREQIYTYRKSLLLVGHTNDGAAVPDDDLRLSMLPTVSIVARTVEQAEKFTPLLNVLSEAELERNEKEREKELKRKKRQTRGRRGVLLPDREPLKTQRTVLGCVDISGSMPTPMPTVGTSRRAAAAAASLTIANLAASENGTGMFPLPVMPPIDRPVLQPATTAPKPPAKRQKTGLLQAPPIPNRVLRPRAKLSASVPTPSTALDTSHLAFTSAPPMEVDMFKAGTAEPSTDRKPSSKVLAKRVKESKEKEYAEGQHPNFINGVWHCSNCGCPETIAIGRRKGPLGDKTMCGECGKYYHRHRRPAQVEYNTDEAFHLRKRQAEDTKRSKRRGGARAAVANVVPQTPDDSSQVPQNAHSPAPSANDDDEDMPPPIVPGSTNSSPRAPPAALSPSGSDTPLAERLERPQSPDSPLLSRRSSEHRVPQVNGSPSVSERRETRPARKAPPRAPPAYPSNAPSWLRECIDAMKSSYPTDNFVALLRPGQTGPSENGQEYRIKCFDCPGMLYKPGPDQSLANFEVHLKNRNHRTNVSRRLSGET